jgi:medium-chain acyl-[acyl-carrier-protein] hydrolase
VSIALRNDSSSSALASSWIAGHKRPAQARIRLFCFPYAGGNAAIYRDWSSALPADVEVCPVQLPGRSNRLSEVPFTELSALVQVLARELSPLLDMPFAIFGHSLGALLGFELARELRLQYGVSPVHLFVSAGSAPQVLRRSAPIHSLPTNELLAEVRRFNHFPIDTLQHQELLDIIVPLLRADFCLFETYAYSTEPPLSCPISAFGGLQDSCVSRPDLEAWRDQTTASFSLRMLAGNHFFLNTTQPLLLQMLSRELH